MAFHLVEELVLPLGQVCGVLGGLDGGGAGLGGRISLVEFCGGGTVQVFGGPRM